MNINPANKYRVWSCKIVVPAGAQLPQAFDGPPRSAAINAVEEAGIFVFGCFSGWGGELTETELRILDGDN